MTRAARGTAALACALLLSGHVGNSNVYFEGMAGAYHLRVIVRVPGVVPGLAQISVRSLDGEPLDLVTVRPLRWDAGLAGAPPADTAVTVAGETGLYDAELWLMSPGSYSVQVTVHGSRGAGRVFVPVLAVAERRLDMNLPMAIGLIGAGLFLFVGAVTIFGAAVRESVLAPGQRPDPTRRRRAGRAMAGGGIVLAVVVWGGWQWWDDVDAAYRASMFRPLAVTAAVDTTPERRLTITIDDEAWLNRTWTPLIPDHGKLMHMFAVRDGDLAGFAHLHPVAADSSTFVTALPAGLPTGEYRLYADIVHESGFAQTLTDTVTVPPAPASDRSPAFGQVETLAGPQPVVDPDNSWALVPAMGTATAAEYALPSGHVIRWDRPRDVTTDTELTLAFAVYDGEGEAANLEPYMGMMSHAAVTRDDGSVFVHLHPSGTINMAAKMRFERTEGETDAGMRMTGMAGTAPNAVRFPFEFTRPGSYRIWVQVKLAGTVETGAFDVTVSDGENGSD